ncbi:hypothetical protein FQN57_000480 [Myotisia sp. PD_48]|nr:hypothetical protein FQN57_000480 [Myotisia sp. PD_48]
MTIPRRKAASGLEKIPSNDTEWNAAVVKHGLKRRTLGELCKNGLQLKADDALPFIIRQGFFFSQEHMDQSAYLIKNGCLGLDTLKTLYQFICKSTIPKTPPQYSCSNANGLGPFSMLVSLQRQLLDKKIHNPEAECRGSAWAPKKNRVHPPGKRSWPKEFPSSPTRARVPEDIEMGDADEEDEEDAEHPMADEDDAGSGSESDAVDSPEEPPRRTPTETLVTDFMVIFLRGIASLVQPLNFVPVCMPNSYETTFQFGPVNGTSQKKGSDPVQFRARIDESIPFSLSQGKSPREAIIFEVKRASRPQDDVAVMAQQSMEHLAYIWQRHMNDQKSYKYSPLLNNLTRPKYGTDVKDHLPSIRRMSSKPSSQFRVPAATAGGMAPPPPPIRTLRRFQSHQSLSSNSGNLTPSSRSSTTRHSFDPRENADLPSIEQPTLPVNNNTPHGRTRSNSDVTAARPVDVQRQTNKRQSGGRKSGVYGSFLKRSGLDTLLRDGPPGNNISVGLEELRYLILSTRVDADSDGMSPNRVYVWLALLHIPPIPTDEYLSLVHRGRSPAYAKIRNDTFRTLATDPLFKRRVTEASLIRLLNAVAWRLHDSRKNSSSKSNPPTSSKYPNTRKMSSDHFATTKKETSLPHSETKAVSSVNSNTNTNTPSAIYVQGMNVLCAPFLYSSRSEVEAYALFHHFITQECPGYVRGTMDGVHKGVKLVDRCLEIVEPKLANHLFIKGMHAELYAFPSVLTLSACTPPLPEVLHLWDFLFAYGPHLNILCIVAQLIRMRDTLLASQNPNKILRAFPPLETKEIIALTVLIVQKIPKDLYEELLVHAK